MDNSQSLQRYFPYKLNKFVGLVSQTRPPNKAAMKMDSVPKIGSRLDVKSLLSNNGKTTHLIRSDGEAVDFDVVLGKHLLICTVSVPLDEGYHYFRAMLDTYSGLSRDCFEMVVVATSDSDNSAFDVFFSELPCLAVPFSDSDTRRCITSFISLNPSSLCSKACGLLLDPTQTILKYRNHENFYRFGAEWFPFLDTNLDAIKIQDQVLRFRLDPLHRKMVECVAPQAVMQDPLLEHPLSLHDDILLCHPSFPLHRFSCDGGPVESITVSELGNKHVGLYLCFKGDFCRTLTRAYRRCIAKGQELEIVVIFVPIFQDLNSMYKDLIYNTRDKSITPPWFVFPDDCKVWRRVWRIFSQVCYSDKLIILPPNGAPGELEGKAIIDQFGTKQYPFTRSIILERRFIKALRLLTPAKDGKIVSRETDNLYEKIATRLSLLEDER